MAFKMQSGYEPTEAVKKLKIGYYNQVITGVLSSETSENGPKTREDGVISHWIIIKSTVQEEGRLAVNVSTLLWMPELPEVYNGDKATHEQILKSLDESQKKLGRLYQITIGGEIPAEVDMKKLFLGLKDKVVRARVMTEQTKNRNGEWVDKLNDQGYLNYKTNGDFMEEKIALVAEESPKTKEEPLKEIVESTADWDVDFD